MTDTYSNTFTTFQKYTTYLFKEVFYKQKSK